MATTRPFAYNTGGPISGTTNFGSTLISGDIEVDYSEDYGGVKWWMGPDEDLGYVIGNSRPGGQPIPSGATGTAQLGFWRSKFKTNESFLELANYIGAKNGQPPFANTTDAENWLNSQGYFSSYDIPTPTPSPTSTLTPTPTPTVTPTSTDLTNITTYTISGCTSLNEFVANLGPGALAPGDIFYFEFTGGTPSGCYRIVNKINAVPTDGTTPLYFYTSCALCVAAREVTPTPTITQTPTTTPTPSVTNTQTPSVTPTFTPTPSTSPVPVTGYGYNLVVLPYQAPTSGNTIFPTFGTTNNSGTTNPNTFTTNGVYWNTIDNSSVDRTNYYSGMTGVSVTAYFTQNGNTAIYSGSTSAFTIEGPPGQESFNYNPGTRPGQLVLIQSASTNFVTGQTVYISYVVNITPTPTSTPTPTNTATPTLTQTPTNTNTQTPTNTPNLQGFSYPNFTSTEGITLVGAAAVSGGTIIALTTTSSASVGNMYRTTAIQYNRNFSTTWSTFIGGGTGADGYCVQWTPTNNTNGPSGASVGLLSTAINAITFLTFTNDNYTWYKNNVSQGATSVSSGFWRQTLYFWGDYNHSAQTFALYYSTTNSKPGSPNQTFNSFSFDTGSYYMGFGAGTGGSNDNQEILSWNLQFT